MEGSVLPTPNPLAASPAAPLPEPSRPTAPEVVPGGPKQPQRGGMWLLAAGLLVGAGAWLALNNQGAVSGPATPTGVVRTAKVDVGSLETTLRVGGALQARNYASISAPRMRGPRDSGRTDLTLMELVQPGSIVKPGEVVARFELKWLEDHIDDRESAMTQSQAQVEKQRAEIMILRETDRQAAVNAKAEYDKAELDLRTAEVRSEIEAEVLANLAQQAKATWQQLEHANTLKEDSHAADLETYKIQVAEDRLHVERHQRDYEKMEVIAPLGGLVVMETMYKGSGQFGQTSEGDQVYPGARFMRVVDTSEMILSAEVNQVDIQNIRMGQTATIRLDAYPDLELEGRITAIGAIAETGGGGKSRYSRGSSGLYLKTVPVEISIDTPDERVIPDLSASADILIQQQGEGVLVPREAVRSDTDGSFVWVRSGQGFQRRAVQPGSANDTHTLVESGLQSGEEVLVSERPPQV